MQQIIKGFCKGLLISDVIIISGIFSLFKNGNISLMLLQKYIQYINYPFKSICFANVFRILVLCFVVDIL